MGKSHFNQPQVVEKAVQDAGCIAADIAENAHITLHELKEKIDAVLEKKLPSFKALMEMKPMAVAQTTVDEASLTVYQNGYAVYEMDGAHTVMAVDCCGDYRYDFTDGTYQVVPAETFEEPSGASVCSWKGNAGWSTIGITALLRLKMCPWNVMAPTGRQQSWWIFWMRTMPRCWQTGNFAVCMQP